MTDDNENVLVRYEYDVFGAVRSEIGSSNNVRKFTGKEFDADVNLYYKINEKQALVLDLDKIWNGDHGRNRQFFKEYPFPKKAYVFEKIE